MNGEKLVNELYHFGVKGMKWGVRKQPQTIEERFKKVGDSKFRSKFHTVRALNVYKTAKQLADRDAKYYTKRARAMGKKLNKYTDEAYYKKYKDLKSLLKASDKANKTIWRAKEYESLAKEYMSQSKLYDRKIDDIKTGKLKAGRDFITELKSAGVFSANTDVSVINKKGKKIASYNMRYY